MALLATAIDIYFYAVFAWVILSWIQVTPGHPLAQFRAGLDRIILPVIRAIRSVVPPIRIGLGAIDLSPIILLVGIRIIGGLF